MGNSSDPAAKGSPYMDKTGDLPFGGNSVNLAEFSVEIVENMQCASFLLVNLAMFGETGGGMFGGSVCIDHTMGFPQVYQPLTKFLLEVLGRG